MRFGFDWSTKDGMAAHVKDIANWVAALLGIGTLAGLVNVVVGVLSGAWIALQLWTHVRYDIPLKRAKLRAARLNLPSDTDRGAL